MHLRPVVDKKEKKDAFSWFRVRQSQGPQTNIFEAVDRVDHGLDLALFVQSEEFGVNVQNVFSRVERAAVVEQQVVQIEAANREVFVVQFQR